jgi:integrase
MFGDAAARVATLTVRLKLFWQEVESTAEPIEIDPHYTPRFYAKLWGISESTVLRWFQDEPGVLQTIGRSSYERLRARAMVLLMRFAGLRISDVSTLSREHIQENYIVKRAVKNQAKLRIELQPVVRQALEALPHPKAAPRDSKLYFASGAATVRTLVKSAEKTLAAVFRRAGVEGAFAHRFRHTFASELLGKGESIEVVAAILGDTPAIIRRHYEKWTPEFQSRKDRATRNIHGTNLEQAEDTATKCGKEER